MLFVTKHVNFSGFLTLGGLDCDWSGIPGYPASTREICEAHFAKTVQVS